MRRALSHRSGSDDLGLRLRVAHLIDSVTFQPPGMSPSSILLVRRLADPLPRHLMPNRDSSRPAREWEQAAQARLDNFHRRAARPAHGFVPASSESVLFDDPGEMLACLASDLLDGNASGLWWWQAILRTLPPGSVEAWFAAWRRDIKYVPAALSHLSARKKAVHVLAALSPAQAWIIFQEVTHEFELYLPTELSPSAAGLAAPPPRIEPATENDGPETKLQSASHAPEIAPPLRAMLSPELVPESLGVERSALLGVALLVRSAPESVRCAQFGRGFAEWYQSAARTRATDNISKSALPSATSQPSSQPVRFSQQSPSPSEKQEFFFDTSASPSTDDLSDIPARSLAPQSVDVPSTLGQQDNKSDPTGAVLASGQEPHFITEPTLGSLLPHEEAMTLNPPESLRAENEPPSPHLLRSVDAPELTDQAPPSRERPHPQRPAVPVLAGEAIPTQLGGVLFLINLLRALKLPDCLESEFGLDPMNGWLLLELLCRCLLGPRHQDLALDPIWDVLASLSGRSSELPVLPDFRGQKRYRLPDSWIVDPELKSCSTICVRLRGPHLELWHPQGFPLLDQVFNVLPTHSAIADELELYRRMIGQPAWITSGKLSRSTNAGCCPLGLSLDPALKRFLSFLLPYLRCRLDRLGIDGRSGLGLTQLLLRRGRLYVTATHVDLVMNMNQASGVVRMSGLDVDPGWVPELGRVVKFSFV